MTLPTSGAIALSDVQSEFGGSNPIAMSEYYLDGSFVSSIGAYTSYQYDLTAPDRFYWVFADVGGNDTSIFWNNSVVANFNGNAGTTLHTAGNFQYNRGTLQLTEGGGVEPLVRYYQVRRRATNINSSVPTSGTISMEDFYGGQG